MKIYLVCGIDHESYENVEFSFHRNFHLAKEQQLYVSMVVKMVHKHNGLLNDIKIPNTTPSPAIITV